MISIVLSFVDKLAKSVSTLTFSSVWCLISFSDNVPICCFTDVLSEVNSFLRSDEESAMDFATDVLIITRMLSKRSFCLLVDCGCKAMLQVFEVDEEPFFFTSFGTFRLPGFGRN